MTTELVLSCLSVAAGALTQRVTGIGFALVSAPLLVLVAGPYQGVVLANLLSLLVALGVFASTWSQTEWRRGVLLSTSGGGLVRCTLCRGRAAAVLSASGALPSGP